MPRLSVTGCGAGSEIGAGGAGRAGGAGKRLAWGSPRTAGPVPLREAIEQVMVSASHAGCLESLHASASGGDEPVSKIRIVEHQNDRCGDRRRVADWDQEAALVGANQLDRPVVA